MGINASTDAQAARAIRSAVSELGEALRARHAWLRHQDAIGLGIFLFASGAIILNAALYARDILPGWWVVLSSAVFMSLLHELEHDLLHTLYFKDNPLVHHLMMAGVWLFQAEHGEARGCAAPCTSTTTRYPGTRATSKSARSHWVSRRA